MSQAERMQALAKRMKSGPGHLSPKIKESIAAAAEAKKDKEAEDLFNTPSPWEGIGSRGGKRRRRRRTRRRRRRKLRKSKRRSRRSRSRRRRR